MHVAFRSLAAVAVLVFAGTAWACQATEPVLELADTNIAVQNG
jgi:hypothetical protein